MNSNGIDEPMVLEAATDVARMALGSLDEQGHVQERLVFHLGADDCIRAHVYVDCLPESEMMAQFAWEDDSLNGPENLQGVLDIAAGRLVLEDDSIVQTGRALTHLDDKSVIAVPKGPIKWRFAR